MRGMTADYCDLHMHSTASDGTDAPRDLPRLCAAAGVGAFALTDHDTTAGLGDCAEAAGGLGLDFLPGIELSTNPDVLNTGRSVGALHLLGYGIDPRDPPLEDALRRLRQARGQRNPLIIERLNELGVRIGYEEVLAVAGIASAADAEAAIVGRPHIGQVLVEKGYVKSIHEAFVRYLGAGGAAYVRRDLLTAADAIAVIHSAGGVAVLAHPVQLRLADHDALEHFVARLSDLGLDGLETRHPDHQPADVERFSRLARRFRLLVAGGSDYHGSRKSLGLNNQRVPRGVFDALREAIAGGRARG